MLLMHLSAKEHHALTLREQAMRIYGVDLWSNLAQVNLKGVTL